MIFYLGTHQPHWLAQADVPLFVSRRRLVGRQTFPLALGCWALDSGGFSELSLFGSWTVSAAQYVEEVRRYRETIGSLAWAVIQDWMCEPFLLAKTGLVVAEHQRRTIASYRCLLDLAPDLPWVPVLQGWHYEDYLEHLNQYDRSGLPWRAAPLVGLGSVCRRQGTAFVEDLIAFLAGEGLRLHGFGFKLQGLARVGHLLTSADSMAWSLAARRQSPLPGHETRHKSCANCLIYALRWRERVLQLLLTQAHRPRQRLLFAEGKP